MNKRLYWIFQKHLRKCSFFLKKIWYMTLSKYEVRKSLSQIWISVLKTMAYQVFVSLLFAFFLSKIDGFLLKECNIMPLSLDMYKDIAIGGMGIAGVILGLYCANIASIFSSKYSNAPQRLSILFRKDIVTNSCIKQIVGYIVFCTIMLCKCVVEFNLGVASLIGLLFLTVHVVITFSMVGNRSYVLSDSFSIADSEFRSLNNTIKHVSKRNLLTKDKNFQNHYRRIASNAISVLLEISTYNANIPINQNGSMLSFMEKNIVLIETYWESKSSIPYDSLWFGKKVIYPQWHTASDTEIDIALKTGTSIQPIEKEYADWLEDALLKVNQECFEKILRDNDISILQRYLFELCETSQAAGENNQSTFWVHYLGEVAEQLKEKDFRQFLNNNIEQEYSSSIIGLLCSNYICIIVGINTYLSKIDLEKIFNKCTQYSSNTQCDIQSIPFLNTPDCKMLYSQIDAELSIEGIRITPDWYIEQMVAAEIYRSVGKMIDSLSITVKSIFDIGKQMQQDGYAQAAATAFSYVFEMINKCKISIQALELLLPQLSSKHKDERIIWDEVSTKQLEKEINIIEEEMPGLLMKCSMAYAAKHWKDREDSPDFLGLCYNHISESLVHALENNNFSKFQEIYKDYFSLVILYQEYVRSDVMKHKEEHLAGIVFHVATAPLLEYALISGLAIIWGEFIGETCWKELVDSSLEVFVEQAEDNQLRLTTIARYLQVRHHDIMGIGNRDAIQTGWVQRIERAIVNSPKFETEYDRFNMRLKTDSKLLSCYCGTLLSYNSSINLQNPEDVYLITCVNKHLPDNQKYQSNWGWEKNYES